MFCWDVCYWNVCYWGAQNVWSFPTKKSWFFQMIFPHNLRSPCVPDFETIPLSWTGYLPKRCKDTIYSCFKKIHSLLAGKKSPACTFLKCLHCDVSHVKKTWSKLPWLFVKYGHWKLSPFFSGPTSHSGFPGFQASSCFSSGALWRLTTCTNLFWIPFWRMGRSYFFWCLPKHFR